MKHNH